MLRRVRLKAVLQSDELGKLMLYHEVAEEASLASEIFSFDVVGTVYFCGATSNFSIASCFSSFFMVFLEVFVNFAALEISRGWNIGERELF
ncbi:MAG: hypothetical protein JWQ35_2367 [Bacteriovoracaceae bacterium]|nr:hypothetical protein [Bacteriovoracaceae bacterium]